jgi:chaperonin GroES
MFCPNDNVLIERDSAEEKTPGGLFIPDSKKDGHAPFRGTVSVVGKKCEYVKVGDHVHFDRTGAFTENIRGKEYVVTKEKDIIVITNRDNLE